MLHPNTTHQFDKDKEKAHKQKKDISILIEVMKKLIEEKPLEPRAIA